MVTALQTFVTRSFDVFDPVVISVGSFHAGTADNVIRGSAVRRDRAIVPPRPRAAATVRHPGPAQRHRSRAG
jgi:hippurate hydrolase